MSRKSAAAGSASTVREAQQVCALSLLFFFSFHSRSLETQSAQITHVNDANRQSIIRVCHQSSCICMPHSSSWSLAQLTQPIISKSPWPSSGCGCDCAKLAHASHVIVARPNPNPNPKIATSFIDFCFSGFGVASIFGITQNAIFGFVGPQDECSFRFNLRLALALESAPAVAETLPDWRIVGKLNVAS